MREVVVVHRHDAAVAAERPAMVDQESPERPVRSVNRLAPSSGGRTAASFSFSVGLSYGPGLPTR